MSKFDRLMNSELFKNAMSGVMAAGNTDFEGYMYQVDAVKKEYSLPDLDVDKYIDLYNNALLSYRMGKITFSELNYIFKSLSTFLDDLDE